MQVAAGLTKKTKGKKGNGEVHLAQDGTGQQLVLQELWRQSVDVNSIEEGVKVLGPTLHVPADPVCAGLVHLRETHRRADMHGISLRYKLAALALIPIL